MTKEKVLITGSSNGIGKATAKFFILLGYEVFGIDKEVSSIYSNYYHHYQLDLRYNELPEIPDVSILINNAGSQNTEDDIDNNLKTAIKVTEKYGIQESIKAILFNASASAHTGFEFPSYVASKGGMISYMKNVACRVAKYNATCNSISCGGVITDLNKPVMEDKNLWSEIMKVTPLKKWATAEEIANWIFFICVTNKSMTGQDILVDNGESYCNNTFIWPEN